MTLPAIISYRLRSAIRTFFVGGTVVLTPFAEAAADVRLGLIAGAATFGDPGGRLAPVAQVVPVLGCLRRLQGQLLQVVDPFVDVAADQLGADSERHVLLNPRRIRTRPVAGAAVGQRVQELVQTAVHFFLLDSSRMPSSCSRGIRCTWRCMTSWPATSPRVARRLIGRSVHCISSAARRAVSANVSGSAAKSLTCRFGTMRQCPSVMGLRGTKATTSGQ